MGTCIGNFSGKFFSFCYKSFLNHQCNPECFSLTHFNNISIMKSFQPEMFALSPLLGSLQSQCTKMSYSSTLFSDLITFHHSLFCFALPGEILNTEKT